ncbi:unnamed protein product [Meganyctiphanes norvegica]|uniref:Protein AAR2 homolog n=1 Tax=Meganyctiphanes norvegica TaxID=48144 RepID=A0AAV2Q620_MEGNR
MEIDQDVARQMFEEGGTLLITGMPVGTEFGIDMNSWNVGEKFKGVKMIPPGLHFVYFSAVNRQGDVAPRTGFFHVFKQRELLVRTYDPVNEDLNPDDTNPDQVERIRANLKDLDKNLGAYPLDSWRKWVSFTQHISEQQLLQMLPLSGKIYSAPQLVAAKPTDMETSATSPEPGKQTRDLPEMEVKPGTEFGFVKIPKKPYKDGASPAEMTKYSMDSSYIVGQLLGQVKNPVDLVGELQFSFVCFLVGQVWEGWEHWRKLVEALCRAEETLLANPDLYNKVLSTLHFQIHEVPEDLFVDIVESNNFLASVLSTLFANIHDSAGNLPTNLVAKARKFKNHIQTKYKWDLSIEMEDDAPVVVQTD